MKEFKRRRSVKHVLRSPILIALLVFVLFFMIRAVLGAYQSDMLSRKELESARMREQELVNRSNFLEKEISQLASERGLEEELREKYSVVKTGEKMVIIVDSQDEKATEYGNEKPGWWEKVKSFFR